jgi:hypothetical protein
MRRVALGCLLTTAGLVAVGAATALSTHVPEQFNQTLTLAGGPATAPLAAAPAYIDDPDAPIATARYGGERSRAAVMDTIATPAASPVPLAGAPAPVVVASAAPLPDPTEVRQPAIVLAVAETRPVHVEPARPAARILAEAPVQRRPALALTQTTAVRPLGKVVRMEINDQPLPFTPMGLQSTAVKRLTLNASTLMSKARASADDMRRGRWLLYVAGSGKAYGLNLIRDTFNGWRNAGVSEERLARFGSRQLGLGWRKDNRQVSLTATRRKLNAIDYSDKDTVVGVTVSVRAR